MTLLWWTPLSVRLSAKNLPECLMGEQLHKARSPAAWRGELGVSLRLLSGEHQAPCVFQFPSQSKSWQVAPPRRF